MPHNVLISVLQELRHCFVVHLEADIMYTITCYAIYADQVLPLEVFVCRLLRTNVALWDPLETQMPLEERQSVVC